MSGYRLSALARAAEDRYRASAARGAAGKATSDFQRILDGRTSLQDGNNFRTNMVTVADFADRQASGNPLGLSATFACVNLIAGTIASLSPSIFVTVDGVKQEDRKHPLFWLLRMDPNYDQTGYDFWEFFGASIELHGNAFAEISRSGGRIVALDPLRPDLVEVKRTKSGALEYCWSVDGERRVRQQGEVLHIRGFGGNALGGCSTLAMCRAVFAGAQDADRSARAIFGNEVRPSGLLQMDEPLTPEQRGELEAALAEKYMGAINAGRPMILDRGLKWQALSLPPEDAQLLESRKFSGEEICRIYGVPPAMVGYGDKASNWGTGKEVDVLGFIKFTLRKRLRRIEQALMKQLLTRAERQRGVTIEFNLEGLLRGDSAGRASFYQIMVRLGVMTRNEARRLENLPPIAGGDVAMVQMQDVPLADAIQGETL